MRAVIGWVAFALLLIAVGLQWLRDWNGRVVPLDWAGKRVVITGAFFVPYRV